MRHAVGSVLVSALALATGLAAAAKSVAPVPTYRSDLSTETVGQPPVSFAAVVGDWSIARDGDANVLRVDGRTWKRGNPAAGLADRARALYGTKHEEFLDRVAAFAYFPYAVAAGVEDFRAGEISVRFKLLGGALDQCAGILFDLKPNGDYLAVRFNDKEDNVVLWTFNDGKRSFVQRADKLVPLPMNEWHELAIRVRGEHLTALLDRERLLDRDLGRQVEGRVGVWAKSDSVSEFSDFTVTPLAGR